MVLLAIAVSPRTSQRSSDRFCRSIGARAGWSFGIKSQPEQWTCYVDVKQKTPEQKQQEEIIKKIAKAEFIRAERELEAEPTYSQIHLVRPLISSGVAEKLKEAGFSSKVVEPLTQTGWTQHQVNELMREAMVKGIAPPRDIKPEQLIVEPEIQTLTGKLTKVQVKVATLSGLGLLIAFTLFFYAIKQI